MVNYVVIISKEVGWDVRIISLLTVLASCFFDISSRFHQRWSLTPTLRRPATEPQIRSVCCTMWAYVCVWNENGVGTNVWNEMSMWLPYYSEVWGSFLKWIILAKLLYKRKYWWALILEIWLQTRHWKLLARFKFSAGPSLAGQDRQMLILGGIFL